jgi:hypothetical protein
LIEKSESVFFRIVSDRNDNLDGLFFFLASNPGRTTMPSIGNTPQFRALLWTNIEKILDLLYTFVAQLYNLARVLVKKKDPITHGTFIDELIKVN